MDEKILNELSAKIYDKTDLSLDTDDIRKVVLIILDAIYYPNEAMLQAAFSRSKLLPGWYCSPWLFGVQCSIN